MKISEQLRAGARYMREHGFSPSFGKDGCSRCFVGSLTSVDANLNADDFLVDILGIDIGSQSLRREGWNTDDAVAALEIAADCAEASGK